MNISGSHQIAKLMLQELLRHAGHEVEIVYYADSTHNCESCHGLEPLGCVFNDIQNVSLECMWCFEVILDVNNPELGGDHAVC